MDKTNKNLIEFIEISDQASNKADELKFTSLIFYWKDSPVLNYHVLKAILWILLLSYHLQSKGT